MRDLLGGKGAAWRNDPTWPSGPTPASRSRRRRATGMPERGAFRPASWKQVKDGLATIDAKSGVGSRPFEPLLSVRSGAKFSCRA